MQDGDAAFDCSFWAAIILRLVYLQVVAFVSNSRFKRDYRLEAYPTGVQLIYWMLLAHFLLCSSRSSIVDGISSSSSSFRVESKGVSWRKIYFKAKLVWVVSSKPGVTCLSMRSRQEDFSSPSSTKPLTSISKSGLYFICSSS